MGVVNKMKKYNPLGKYDPLKEIDKLVIEAKRITDRVKCKELKNDRGDDSGKYEHLIK